MTFPSRRYHHFDLLQPLFVHMYRYTTAKCQMTMVSYSCTRIIHAQVISLTCARFFFFFLLCWHPPYARSPLNSKAPWSAGRIGICVFFTTKNRTYSWIRKWGSVKTLIWENSHLGFSKPVSRDFLLDLEGSTCPLFAARALALLVPFDMLTYTRTTNG